MDNKIQYGQKINPIFGAQKVEKKKDMSMEELIEEALKRLHKNAQNYVPEYGDFSPVMEFFDNPDELTQEFVGRYGLKIYKMPKDVVADPKMRYIEAAAYVPSGVYKSDMTVGSGNKEEVLKMLKDPEFVIKLKDTYKRLEEVFENYD